MSKIRLTVYKFSLLRLLGLSGEAAHAGKPELLSANQVSGLTLRPQQQAPLLASRLSRLNQVRLYSSCKNLY